MTVEEYDLKEWNNLFYQGYVNGRPSDGCASSYASLRSRLYGELTLMLARRQNLVANRHYLIHYLQVRDRHPLDLPSRHGSHEDLGPPLGQGSLARRGCPPSLPPTQVPLGRLVWRRQGGEEGGEEEGQEEVRVNAQNHPLSCVSPLTRPNPPLIPLFSTLLTFSLSNPRVLERVLREIDSPVFHKLLKINFVNLRSSRALPA